MKIFICSIAMLFSSEKEEPADKNLNPQTDPFKTMYLTL